MCERIHIFGARGSACDVAMRSVDGGGGGRGVGSGGGRDGGSGGGGGLVAGGDDKVTGVKEPASHQGRTKGAAKNEQYDGTASGMASECELLRLLATSGLACGEV